MSKKWVSIIGTGALGAALSRALAEANYAVAGIYNRTERKAKKIAESVGAERFAVFPNKKAELGYLVYLTVPDQHIRQVANRLAELSKDFSGFTIAHCSGNEPSSVLKPLRDKGASVASFHPIQTFTAASQPSDFEGIFIDIEGGEGAMESLEQVAEDLGAQSMQIPADAKPYLHAAAVMASNNLVALIESATRIAALGDIDKNMARQALMPLVQQSVKNISASPKLVDALSGPVARGDSQTVAKHLALLESNPGLQAPYKQLGKILVELVGDDGSEAHKKISKLLDEDDI